MNPAKYSNYKLWIAPTLLVLIVMVLFSTVSTTQSQSAAKLLLEPAIDIPTVESEHPYANNFDDFWTIEMAGAEAVRIHFSRIELEENADYLIISDPSEKRTQVITGNYPDGLWTDPVPGSFVTVRLETDVSVRKWGFAIDQKEAVSYPSILRSAHPYHDNTNKTWTVLNDDSVPGDATRVHFSRIDLEENVDWLILSDLDGNPFEYITGSHPDGMWSIGIPGIAAKIQLITDSNETSWGFNIDATQTSPVDIPLAKPTFPTQIESDHPYTDNKTWEWTLVNPDPTASSTKVHFTRISLSEADYLRVVSADDVVIQTFNPKSELRNVWSDYVPGRIVKIRFATAQVGHIQDTDWGFRLDRIANSVEMPGLIESHHPYPDNKTWEWTLINPDPEALSTKVHFDRITLSENDYIRILDSEDTVIQTYSPGKTTGGAWSDYVPGRIVKIRFTTAQVGHIQDTDWGFRLDRIANSVEKPGIIQSHHPYPDNKTWEWTLTNPNGAAASTSVHFHRISLSEKDYIRVLDTDGTIVQVFNPNTKSEDVWSDYVPGRIVKIRFTTAQVGHIQDTDWGFRIDDIFPANENPITPAAINGVYVQVYLTGRIYLNDILTSYAQEPGEYKILLPGEGEHRIRIEYMEYTQDIFVIVTERGCINIIYLPVQEKELGFRIEDISKTADDPIPPAAITSIYAQVNHPGHIFVNDTEVAYAQEPGEYKVMLPGMGEHHIRIEYMGYTQTMLATITERAGIHVIYLPVQEKD